MSNPTPEDYEIAAHLRALAERAESGQLAAYFVVAVYEVCPGQPLECLSTSGYCAGLRPVLVKAVNDELLLVRALSAPSEVN